MNRRNFKPLSCGCNFYSWYGCGTSRKLWKAVRKALERARKSGNHEDWNKYEAAVKARDAHYFPKNDSVSTEQL